MKDSIQSLDIARMAVEALKAAGAEKAQASFSRGVQSEMNIDAGQLSLYRSTVNVALNLGALVDQRKGGMSINKYDPQSIKQAAAETVAMAKSSEPDAANDISPARALERFDYGPQSADSAAMYDRLQEFIDYCRSTYPDTNLEQCILDFSRGDNSLVNSNGAEFQQYAGHYSFSAMFTTKKGRDASSFNYSGATSRDLNRPLQDWGSVDLLMRQSTEQTKTSPVDGAFEGDLLIAPDCLGDFLGGMEGVYLGDYPIITKTSPWYDSLGKSVSSPLLTIRSLPNSTELHANSPYTADGFRTEDCNLINKGVLENFAIGLYASNKSGKARCPSGAAGICVDPGDQGWQEMIGGIKKGLLLVRFSGGSPSDNGDFSGVAKNSYLIEDGRISRPVSETMIAGNIAALLRGIRAVSKERVNYGNGILPWVLAGPVQISGQ